MVDIKWIRSHAALFSEMLRKRGAFQDVEEILVLDTAYRAALTQEQELKASRNALAKEIGKRKAHGQSADDLILQSAVLEGDENASYEKSLLLGQKLQDILQFLPNMLSDDVPEGTSEEHNQEIRRWGDERKDKPFLVKDHVDLGKGLGAMDFEQAAAMSGARFVVLTGGLARLERALASWMLDTHTERFGFTEVHTPCLVKPEAVYGAGQLPKFEEELFSTADGRYLVSTSEVTLVNMGQGKTFSLDQLPLKLTAYTPCFRSEAGASGKDTRGMMRLHQFEKVELVVICTPEEADLWHQKMVQQEEYLLQSLGLPYRLMKLCSGDMGAASCKTYDLEVWLPSQKRYREISSCSNCASYQSLRLGMRYRKADGTLGYPCTLNGSGLPTGRSLIAILENYQQEDGSVLVPEILRPYMGGVTCMKVGG